MWPPKLGITPKYIADGIYVCLFLYNKIKKSDKLQLYLHNYCMLAETVFSPFDSNYYEVTE
jgi:hypothetical protein